MDKLKFFLVSRHLNRGGYAAIERCLSEGISPQGVIVHTSQPLLSRRYLRVLVKILYKAKCWFYRCPALRMLDSEVILARKHRIPLHFLPTLKDSRIKSLIEANEIDLLVVAGGWHEKIPIDVITAPRLGAINIHPSLLPSFRGTSITRWQILEGVPYSGVTIHYMDAEFDSGEIIAQKALPVVVNETPQSLFARLATEGAQLLIAILKQFCDQDSMPVTATGTVDSAKEYYRKWRWDSDQLSIRLTDPFKVTHQRVLACTQESYEYPGVEVCLSDRKFVVRRTSIVPNSTLTTSCRPTDNETIGTVINGEIVCCKKGDPDALRILVVQPCKPWFQIRRADKPGRWFPEDSTVRLTLRRRCDVWSITDER